MRPSPRAEARPEARAAPRLGLHARLPSGMLLLLVPAAVAGLAWAMPSMSDAAAADIGWEVPARGPWYRLWAWAAASLVGAAYALAAGTGLRRAGGLALMCVPVARTALGIVNDASILATSGQTLPTYSPYELSGFYMYAILRNLGYLGAGFILWSEWRPRQGIRGLAKRLAATGAPILGRTASEGRGAWLGFLLFPVLLLGTVGVDAVLQRTPELVRNDQTSIWDAVTPFHAILISAAAALGEEAVYRVFLMTALASLLQRTGLRARPAWAGALVLQAVFFGFAHASYANWSHVIQASLFGLVAGIGALWLGVWVAIVLHFLVDIYAIGVHADEPLWIGFLVALLVANGVATLVAGGTWLTRRAQRTQPP